MEEIHKPKTGGQNVFRFRLLMISAIALLGFMVSRQANSQAPDSSWVSLDGSKPGTPAEVVFDARSSSRSTSVLNIVIHGFFAETKDGPNGRYTKVSVPGMPTVEQVGAPSLPVMRFDLAVPASDASAKLRYAKPAESK